jgi:hypothetical protein
MKLTKSRIGSICATLLVLFTLNLKAQIKETFDDGSFLTNPQWVGDTAKFKVFNNKLQSKSSVVNDKFYLSTVSKSVENTQWEFFINLQFNTSSTNFVDVFLTSDSANLASNNSGYLVRIGTPTDNISLLKKVGTVYTSLINGKAGTTNHSSNTFKIKVTCDAKRNFTLWYDSTGLGNNFMQEGNVWDTTFNQSNYFGISIKQSTASFHNRHFFDDFYIGKIITDTIKPFVKNVEIKSPDTLRIYFSEILHSISLNLFNFDINNTIGNPFSSRFISADSSVIEIALVNSLAANTWYNFGIKNCKDKTGNKLEDTVFQLKWFQTEKPLKNDIVIHELMPDPEPMVGLPKEEFVEFYNRSDKILQLQNCFFSDNTSSGKLPYFVLEPDSFLILCEAGNESLFSPFGRTMGIKGFPSLNNSGDALFIKNADGQLIHQVKYDLTSYRDELKSDGGWSLEMIDVDNLCNPNNFKASVASIGGSPGKINSVKALNPDNEKPFIKKVTVKLDLVIQLMFSETFDSLKASDIGNYQITENVISGITVTKDILELKLVQPLVPNKFYNLTVNGIVDNCNNILDTSFQIIMAEKPKSGDIVINEILFNPTTGGADFIEIYNRTNKILSLKNLTLYNLDKDKQPDDISQIDTLGTVFLPNAFMVFTTNPSWVSEHYKKCDSTAFIKVPSLPTMADDAGHIRLVDEAKTIIDEMDYSKSMHFQLLTNFEGVSLERISYDVSSSEISNWTSAAATSGFATPGLVNSHSLLVNISDDWLSISPTLFSPDEDGVDDVASFTIQSTSQNQQATLVIFDIYGKLVTTLVNNSPIGTTQTWFWDGMDKDGRKTTIGIYIVYAELFGLDGKKHVQKKTVTVGGK